jgi:serine/threonine protein kinase
MNIFIGETSEAVIADFGLARALSTGTFSGQEETRTMELGTPQYMAPELIDGDGTYDFSVDVYAFGVVLYAMFAKTQDLCDLLDTGVKAKNRRVLMRHILQGGRYKRLDGIPEACWKLITQCWSPAPSARPSFERIVTLMAGDVHSFVFPGANESEVRAYAQSLQ